MRPGRVPSPGVVDPAPRAQAVGSSAADGYTVPPLRQYSPPARQQFLVDEITPPQRNRRTAWRLGNPLTQRSGSASGSSPAAISVKRQAAPRDCLAGMNLDPASLYEHPPPLDGRDRLDDGCRVKVGHDHIVRPAAAATVRGSGCKIISAGVKGHPCEDYQSLSWSGWTSSVTTSVSGRVAERRPLAFCQ